MLKQFLILVCLSVAIAERTTSDSIHIINDSSNLNQEEFASEALMAHNLYRRIHGVPSLRLNSKLVDLAVTRARELATDGKLNVKQILFNKENLGETVGTVGGFSSYNGISATQLWYSVVSKFDEEGESSNEGASFTQMVWKKTREVGFGIAKGKDGKFYFVAEYFPSGNIRGQYEDNVFQLTEEEASSTGSNSRCVNQTVVDMWRRLLNKANLNEDGERVQTTTPEASKIVVEMPNKKLKSKMPIITQNEEIVRSTRRPAVESEDVESTTLRATSRPIVSSRTTTPVVSRFTTEADEVEERTTSRTTPRRVRPTTGSSEMVEETTVRPVRPVSKGTERVEEEETTTRRVRPVVVIDDESTSTRRQRPVVVETTETIRLTTVNPDLIITAEPLEEEFLTTTQTTTTRRASTTQRTTTAERITTTTPEREEVEETTTGRFRTTTEEPENRVKFRPSSERTTTVEVEELPSKTTERTTVESVSTTRKAVPKVSTLLKNEEDEDIDRHGEHKGEHVVVPEKETTVRQTTTSAPVTTRRTTPEMELETTVKLPTVPRMTPTVLEEASQRPSKSKLLEQIKNAEEVKSTTRSVTSSTTESTHVHDKKELNDKEAEEESSEKREMKNKKPIDV